MKGIAIIYKIDSYTTLFYGYSPESSILLCQCCGAFLQILYFLFFKSNLKLQMTIIKYDHIIFQTYNILFTIFLSFYPNYMQKKPSVHLFLRATFAKEGKANSYKKINYHLNILTYFISYFLIHESTFPLYHHF